MDSKGHAGQKNILFLSIPSYHSKNEDAFISHETPEFYMILRNEFAEEAKEYERIMCARYHLETIKNIMDNFIESKK